MSFHVPNKYRIRRGPMASDEGNGNNGAFFVPVAKLGGHPPLQVIASDGAMPGGQAWEHVSVSLPHRCPTWGEMCRIKAIFWDDEDCVIQFHPPKSDHINNHPFCLHLWRPVGVEFPRPDSLMVGVKGLEIA